MATLAWLKLGLPLAKEFECCWPNADWLGGVGGPPLAVKMELCWGGWEKLWG
jgi:hypothetical protein